jgi:hypothetical protein
MMQIGVFSQMIFVRRKCCMFYSLRPDSPHRKPELVLLIPRVRAVDVLKRSAVFCLRKKRTNQATLYVFLYSAAMESNDIVLNNLILALLGVHDNLTQYNR